MRWIEGGGIPIGGLPLTGWPACGIPGREIVPTPIPTLLGDGGGGYIGISPDYGRYPESDRFRLAKKQKREIMEIIENRAKLGSRRNSESSPFP